ncbi:MAG: peroxiredoxin, partial [Gammaproteobacteria bacterium]
MLKAGDKAPDFSLPTSDMEMKSLGDYANKWLLLYFYPKDDTPGCTIQATDFTDMLDEYLEAGIEIAGVSADNCIDHQAFRDKFGLLVTLLADVDKEACTAYGVLHEREVDGEIRTGIMRSTFVIDPQSMVRYAEYSVAPKDHAKNMLPKI